MNAYVNLGDEIICDFFVPSKMKKVWNVEIDILENIKRICNKYNLTYYAIAGTLLGAIRHNGFIPWDDDLDIGMPRDDYNSFVHIAEKELPDYLFMQTYLNTKSFPYDMIKVRNSLTTGFTPWEAQEKCNKGIFIDIFPIDNFPDDAQIRLAENKELKKLLNMGANFSRKSESEGKLKGIKSIIKYLMRSFPWANWVKKSIIEQVIRICTRHNKEKTDYCGMRSFSSPEKFIWKSSSCTNIVEVRFEKTTINVPAEYEDVLRSIYGDYNIFVKADSFHEGTTFDPDIPYEIYKI